MDIDDILAEVSGAAVPQEQADLEALTRAWVSERVAPEILPYPSALMTRVTARMRAQIDLVEEQTGCMDPRTSFRLIVVQTELERFKYLVRSYLRARIKKIDRCAVHMLASATAEPAGVGDRLSEDEWQYLRRHQALLSNHYAHSFLAAFPRALQRLDDTAGGISMVEKPEEDKAVFVRCLMDCHLGGEDGGKGNGLGMRRGISGL